MYLLNKIHNLKMRSRIAASASLVYCELQLRTFHGRILLSHLCLRADTEMQYEIEWHLCWTCAVCSKISPYRTGLLPMGDLGEKVCYLLCTAAHERVPQTYSSCSCTACNIIQVHHFSSFPIFIRCLSRCVLVG